MSQSRDNFLFSINSEPSVISLKEIGASYETSVFIINSIVNEDERTEAAKEKLLAICAVLGNNDNIQYRGMEPLRKALFDLAPVNQKLRCHLQVIQDEMASQVKAAGNTREGWELAAKYGKIGGVAQHALVKSQLTNLQVNTQVASVTTGGLFSVPVPVTNSPELESKQVVRLNKK